MRGGKGEKGGCWNREEGWGRIGLITAETEGNLLNFDGLITAH